MNPMLRALGALLLGVASASAQVSAPGDSVLAGPIINPANGHSYFLLSSASWTRSEELAVSLGGHLATVNDAAENAWIARTFSKFDGQDRPLWIGLTDREVEGHFTWVGGEPASFFKWNTETGEPNNASGAYEEDFAYMIESDAGNATLIPGQWNDAPDSGYGVNRKICGVVEVMPAAPANQLIRTSSSVSWGGVGAVLAVGLAGLLVLVIGGVLIGVILWRDKKARDAGGR